MKCPSRQWTVRQLVIIAAIVLIVVAFIVWKSKRSQKKHRRRNLMDGFLSKLKIVIGFYQVTHGVLDVFSYIKWPGSMEVISKYSGILQLNVLQIAPIHCLFSGLRVDALGDLCLIMAINITVICAFGIAYSIRKVIISKRRDIGDVERSIEISQTKEVLYRNLFFFLYITYLSTVSKTASVLPFACRPLCRDQNEEICDAYLKVDYSVKCQGTKYNHLLTVAYIATAYIFALPTASFIALWRNRRAILIGADRDTPVGKEMIAGLHFIFENYQTRSWYWELVEMTRKVILTSGLILVGQESRSYIGLAWVVAGMYGMLFCWVKPVQDAFENRLMSTSLAVTVVNLGIGAVSRIPAENIPGSMDLQTDPMAMKILILGANSLVIGLLVGKIKRYEI